MKTVLFGFAVFATAAWARDWKTEVRDPISHTFTNANSIDVDNINGSVEVRGDGGGAIRVEGERIIRGADAAAVERAKRETNLDMNQKDGVAQIYANGPFRDREKRTSDDHGFHDHAERDYEVSWNVIAHVPRGLALRLHTVNGGIKVEDTNGKYDVKSVNGAIAMRGIAGSGSVETVNGATTVTFRENPRADSSFKSLNGKLEASFQAGLAANLSVKTFNGGAYTDFEATPLAAPAEAAETKDGKYVFRANRVSRLRVGAGGPELKFETFNGSIQIRKVQ